MLYDFLAWAPRVDEIGMTSDAKTECGALLDGAPPAEKRLLCVIDVAPCDRATHGAARIGGRYASVPGFMMLSGSSSARSARR